MLDIVEIYIEDLTKKLENTPEAARINELWVKGLLCISEAIDLLLDAAEKDKFNYKIQYQVNEGERFKTYDDTIYNYREVQKELERLKEAVPGFSWRYKKEKKVV